MSYDPDMPGESFFLDMYAPNLSNMKGSTKRGMTDYIIGEKIGHGVYGYVYLAEDVIGKKYAAKFVEKKDGAQEELILLFLRGTPGVIQLYDAFDDDKDLRIRILITSPYCRSTLAQIGRSLDIFSIMGMFISRFCIKNRIIDENSYIFPIGK